MLGLNCASGLPLFWPTRGVPRRFPCHAKALTLDVNEFRKEIAWAGTGFFLVFAWVFFLRVRALALLGGFRLGRSWLWAIPRRRRPTGPAEKNRHSIWHLTAETGRKRETRQNETRPRRRRHIWQRLGDRGRQAGDTALEPASGIRLQRLGDTGREAGDTTRRRDLWETQGDKRETRPRSQRRSIWYLTAETGRPGGKRKTRRLGDKRGTRPRSRRHSIWTGRHRETSGRHDPGAGVTASGLLTGETGRQQHKQKTGPRNRRSQSPYPQCFAVLGIMFIFDKRSENCLVINFVKYCIIDFGRIFLNRITC